MSLLFSNNYFEIDKASVKRYTFNDMENIKP
jgi:hypothetical protein